MNGNLRLLREEVVEEFLEGCTFGRERRLWLRSGLSGFLGAATPVLRQELVNQNLIHEVLSSLRIALDNVVQTLGRVNGRGPVNML